MKRIIVLLSVVALMLACLTSCDVLWRLFGNADGVEYKEYENCAIFKFDNFDDITTVKLSRTGLGEGAIYYHADLHEGAVRVKYKESGLINEPQELFELSADDEMPVTSSRGYVEGDKISITFEAYSPVSGEIIIAFDEDALRAVDRDLQLHEHTGMWTPENQSTHIYRYNCGCNLPDREEEHINEDGDAFCDLCGYEFGGSTAEVFFLKDYAEWLSELDAESVREIKTEFQYVGIAPGELKEVKSTTDKAVISDVIENYTLAVMSSTGNSALVGGSSFSIEFILADGEVQRLTFYNGIYAYSPESEDSSSVRYFRMDYIPTLQSEPYDNVRYYSAFVGSESYGGVYSSGRLLCDIPIRELEFVELEKDVGVPDWEMYTLKTPFGDLVFRTDTVFYINSRGYRLVGKTIEQLIDEYTPKGDI